MVSRGARIAACLGALLTACASAPAGDPSDAGGDAGGEATLEVELATGARGWEPFEDGEVLRLQRGCQGSQHVFVSIRVSGAAEGPLELDLVLRRHRDGESVSLPYVLRLPFTDTPEPGVREQTGLTPVVPIPADVLDEEVTLEASVVDTAGARGAVVRRALIAWGPDAC